MSSSAAEQRPQDLHLIWRGVCQVGVVDSPDLQGFCCCSGGRGVGLGDGVASLICGDWHPRALFAVGGARV
jgi:hypothetical protein